MQVTDKLYTTDEFREFENRPENAAKNFELINGAMVEMPSVTPLHAWMAFQIGYLIRAFFGINDIGSVFGDSTDYDLVPGLTLRPDASFVSKAKMPKFPKRFNFAPDIAVEVVSPSNTLKEMQTKVEAFIQYGSQLVWVIYSDDKTVRAYRPSGDGQIIFQTLTADEMLDGGAALPGFSVKVNDIFPTIEEEE